MPDKKQYGPKRYGKKVLPASWWRTTGSRLRERLVAARQQAGETQRTLEYRSGVSRTAIAQIEAGLNPNPRLSTIYLLADALGVKAEYLIARRPRTKERTAQ